MLGLFEQFQRDRDGRIRLSVKLVEETLNDRGGGPDVFRRIDRHRDLADFQLLDLERTRFDVNDNAAGANVIGRERDVCILVKILGGREAAADTGGRGFRLRHADHAVCLLPDLHRFVDRVVNWKQFLGRGGPKDDDIVEPAVVEIGEESAAAQMQPILGEIVRQNRDHPTFQFSLQMAKVLASFAGRGGIHNGRDRGGDPIEIGES